MIIALHAALARQCAPLKQSQKVKSTRSIPTHASAAAAAHLYARATLSQRVNDLLVAGLLKRTSKDELSARPDNSSFFNNFSVNWKKRACGLIKIL